MELFEFQARQNAAVHYPLAERMRPRRLDQIVGQEHVTAKGRLMESALRQDRPFSMILWGPPGCGKTTLAKIISDQTRCNFISFSAVLSGVKEIRSVIDTARKELGMSGRRTILFVDEIHRLNKAQQDAFLQHVESGLITLIGATTENPSFEVIAALLSRCRVIVLHALKPEHITILLRRAVQDPENGFGQKGITISDKALACLADMADGDARMALNSLEVAAELVLAEDREENRSISLKLIETVLQKKALLYDKNGEEHYNLISAFHKSMRGSDPDAALYWLARMVTAGEDPLYIARRMVRFASEDVGMADPWALNMALNAVKTYQLLGSPEGELALAQAAVYLATAPKSNRVYSALQKAFKIAKSSGALPVPHHIRNAPTTLMKDLGYGKNYRYAHDYENAIIDQEYLPPELKKQQFYKPSDRGYEKSIQSRMAKWQQLKQSLAYRRNKR